MINSLTLEEIDFIEFQLKLYVRQKERLAETVNVRHYNLAKSIINKLDAMRYQK